MNSKLAYRSLQASKFFANLDQVVVFEEAMGHILCLASGMLPVSSDKRDVLALFLR